MTRSLLIGFLILSRFSLAQHLPTPKEFLGYELGSKFTRHHQVVDYFTSLEVFGSAKVMNYGKTAEGRDLIVGFISTKENLERLDEIKKNHDNLYNENIAIVWMSYNVHGNESSATEASMLTAYELITEKQDWLKNTLVIIDPCINPDGRDRYVNWYNQTVGSVPNVNPQSAEHREPWPSGRPNHYLFDLNRDWAWLSQEETKQRIQIYNQWLPHVHVDFHEQGMNEPYYFAPAAEPYHEVITPFQREFQTGIGKNNASYFDKKGWLYFTREIFDLLYPSYGDTYPTYSGAVGMTYEQGGSGRAGLAVLTDNGDTLTLKDRLTHHHVCGLSTVEYSSKNANKLIEEFQHFSKDKNYKYKSYIVSGNAEKIQALQVLLDGHDIEYSFGSGTTVKGFDYSKNTSGSMKADEESMIINTNQKKGTLVNVLFEPKTKLSDSLTYDITAWSLPYAYGLNAIASESLVTGKSKTRASIANIETKDAYAYLVEWNSMADAKFLAELIKMNVRVRFSETAFKLTGKKYAPGTLIITRADNENLDFNSTVIAAANKFQIVLFPTPTGMVDEGKDFGSSSVKLIKEHNVALLKSDAASSLNFGEIWHFIEKELNYPLTVINENEIGSALNEKITAFIIPEGWYSSLSGSALEGLKTWIQNGGKVIVFGEALGTFTELNGFGLETKTADENEKKEEDAENKDEMHEHVHVKYDQQERNAIKETITGAIFRCKIDHTHPLAFGYTEDYFTLKLSPSSYTLNENISNVVYMDEKAELISGFAGSTARKNLPNSVIFAEENLGDGSLIYMVDNPLFRGFWENGKLFFVNALFLTNNE